MGGHMSKVVLGSVRPEQAQQADGGAPRPRKGRPVNGRRISMAQRADPVEQLECRGCRHWRPFVTQWGHCGCQMVRRHVDGEAPLVTKGSFSCKFFSPAPATDRKPRALQTDTPVPVPMFAAPD